MRRHLTVLLACALAGPFGCGPREPSPRDVPLRAVETFDWSGQPIAFAAPLHGWERQRDQPGGVESVRFINAGSVGEEVHTVEHFTVGSRDRCARLREIARDLDNMDRRTFDRALYDPQGLPSWVRAEVDPPVAADLNGRPAFRQDYRLHDSGRDYVGRRVYVLVNNRLSEIGF